MKAHVSPIEGSKEKFSRGNISDREHCCRVKAADCPQPDTTDSQKGKRLFSIPPCAWSRYLGDVPSGCCSSSPDRGVALGGFGAGSFMYSISGSFGPWALKIAGYDEKWLPEGAFHLYEKIDGEEAKVRCLSTNKDLKEGWDKLKQGEGRYFALQPKGWTTYDCFVSDVASEFYSPIIAHNYKETSYPVAVWKWKFANPTNKRISLSLMFTWSQPPFEDQMRAGYKNSFLKANGVKAVVLNASSPRNSPETQNTEWCLAVKEADGVDISYVTSWNKEKDGRDVWDDFKENGALSDKALDGSNSAAAICFKIELKPNEEKTVPFALAWDYPVCEFSARPGKSTQWWKKYTQHFGREGNKSFEIASEALSNYVSWEKEMDAWMEPVIENENYPEWLKCAAFNELYYSQFGGCFYEAGLKSGHNGKYPGKRRDDNKYFIMECMMYPFCNTFDVRHYSSIIYAKFWPRIEKEILLSWADAILNEPENQTPHDCGGPRTDPYFTWDNYGTNKLHWKDLHSKFIQQIWRYYYLYKDGDFLNYVWPACKATYEYMKKTDTDGDCLPNNKGSDNTYDAWGLWGTSLLCGGLWVGALQTMERIAEIKKDGILKEVREWLKKAGKNLDEKLWYEKRGYYKIDTESKYPTAIMADGLNGQRYCEAYGLEDILPGERLKLHLRQVFERNVVPLKDYNGDGIGDCGAINGIREDGGCIGSKEQAEEIWTGASYFLAASMYHAGLKEEALKTAFGIYYITYEEESTAYWFNTPEAWRNGGTQPRPTHPEQYQRPRAVWELIFEINDPYIK
ncbi:MAG: hypothetical protein KAJ66_04185 [Candidatus Omnitrophica bacterium]|nr:hypothetical protein [Candidatus Omnitrophota bacterium]